MFALVSRSRRFGFLVAGVLAAGASAAAGCSGDDTGGASQGDAGGTDAAADTTTDATIDATTDTGGGADTGARDTGTGDGGGGDANDAGIDSGPPFDCTNNSPDGGGTFQLPNDLRCTGLYSDWASKTVAADARPYAPAYPLWSDGAVKSRWIHLPPGAKIDATDPNEWTFPVGTKLWKEFVVGGKRIETRLYQKVGDADWSRTTYQWSADESAAKRLDTGFGGPPADAGVIDDGGGADAATYYEIPSVAKCDGCHSGRLDKVLGFEAVNLGGAAATGVTLAVLKSEGLLVVGDGGASPLPATLTIPDDSTGKGAASVGWLHSNCGIACHNANPTAGCTFNSMRLRVEVEELLPSGGGAPTLQAMQTYVTTHDVAASTTLGNPAITYNRITHGDPSKSLIRYLIGRRVTNEVYGQMPPIDSHTVDVADVANLNAWITLMP